MLTESQMKVLDVSSKTKGHAGYSAQSSIRHLYRAFELAKSMPEISAFLAITAEEEASTALFLALKNKGYESSKRLKKHDHKHKGGVYPFLILLGETLNLLKHEPKIEVTFDIPEDGNNELLKTRIFVGKVDGNDTYLYPDPPLNLVSVDSSGKTKDYLKDVKKVAQDKGISSIFEYIRLIANIRNQMLYASDKGIPIVENVGEILQRHIGATLLIHIIYLFVVQNPKQNLVEECVNVFMKIQDRLEHEKVLPTHQNTP